MPTLSDIKTPIGWMRFHATSAGVTQLDWQITPFEAPFELSNTVSDIKAADVSRETSEEMSAYLAGKLQQFTVPLDLSAQSRSFQKWLHALCQIPYGEVVSYADLAEIWGNRLAARPAGQACRRNPLAIIIPCHRVNNAGGHTHRYGGGDWSAPAASANLERKQWLQTLESTHAA